MTHIFNEKHFKKLDSPERRKILPIDDVISLVGLTKDMVLLMLAVG